MLSPSPPGSPVVFPRLALDFALKMIGPFRRSSPVVSGLAFPRCVWFGFRNWLSNLAFAALALLEQVIPRRSEEANKGSRWRTNWSFIIIDSFFLKLLAFAIPLLAIGAAVDAKANSIGILNLFDWPIVIEFILSILILDFAIWDVNCTHFFHLGANLRLKFG